MSTGKRRVFSREFKLSAVKRVLAGESVAALSGELGVPSGHMYKWRQQYRAGGAEALRLACRPRKGTEVVEREAGKDLVTARARISELERKVGQQQVDLDFFQRALRQVRDVRQRSGTPGATVSTR